MTMTGRQRGIESFWLAAGGAHTNLCRAGAMPAEFMRVTDGEHFDIMGAVAIPKPGPIDGAFR